MKRHLLIMCAVLLFFNGQAFGQERVISGKVTSAEDNSTAPGVNISVKGTSTGTSTDAEGNYRISVPGNDAILVFSFVGFKPVEVAVGNRSTIDLQMEVNTTELTEAVVIGYGTQLKQDLTGNVAKVRGEDIQNIPVTTFEQAVQGRAAGVLITSQNGKLGQGINIRIRGSSSISANNEPLYVVDGMIITTDNLSSNGAATNPLADINPNDIQSLEILKDASAAALYGSRGANGVVLITTKRGKAGKTNFSANLQFGSSKPTRHRKFLNSGQYVELMLESALNNDNANGLNLNDPDDYDLSDTKFMTEFMDYLQGDTDWRSLETNTNWEKQAYQKANLKAFDFSASGGNDKTQFALGIGYSDQDGILIGNAFKRLSGRLNLDHKATEKLSFGLNAMLSNSINDRLAADNAFATPLQMAAQAPITPVRDKEGHLYSNSDYIDGVGYSAMSYYPATMELENSKFVVNTFRNLISLNAAYKITDDLRILGEYGLDLLTQNDDRYQNEYTDTGLGIGGYGQSRWTKAFNYTGRLMLNWDKILGSHNISLTAGTEYQEKTISVTDAQAQGFPLKELAKLVSASEPVITFSNFQQENFVSVFARANYKFNNRYLLSVSGRVDGSSKFGPDSKYGFFPAASAGWILSEEGFLSESSAISFLKLRASYGVTGNAGIPNYSYLAQYSGVAYGGDPGLAPSQTPNPELQWEKQTSLTLDLILDFSTTA